MIAVLQKCAGILSKDFGARRDSRKMLSISSAFGSSQFSCANSSYVFTFTVYSRKEVTRPILRFIRN